MGFKWSIYVELPKNRSKDGMLYFNAFTANNPMRVFTHSCKCHGEGVKNYPWYHEDGDTPTGEAQGRTKYPASDKDVYGPYKRIEFFGAMTGQLAEVYDKDHKPKPRKDLQIHGGRDQNKLWNTKGCLRIFDKDIKIITDYIDGHCEPHGIINIEEN